MTRRSAILAATAAACLATAPALAWDVQTRVTFGNQSGGTVTADMHGETPNMTIEHGTNREHSSYYSGRPGRGYHLYLTAADGGNCRVSVLVRNDGTSSAGNYAISCEVNATSSDGLNCTKPEVQIDTGVKQCWFRFGAIP